MATTLDITRAQALAAAAARYAETLQASGKHTDLTDITRFELCNAIIDLIDDGDAWQERETLMGELEIDDEGNPVDSNGFRLGDASFGLHHPDSPSFGRAF